MLFKISDFALYGQTLKKAYMTVKTNFYFSINYLLNCKGDMEWEATIARGKKKKVSRYQRSESVYSSLSSEIYLTLYYLNKPQYAHFKFGSIQRKRTRKQNVLALYESACIRLFLSHRVTQRNKVAQIMKYSLGKAGWGITSAGGQ